MLKTLWMKFSEDASLPASFTPQEQQLLEDVYDPTNPQSVWSRALNLLALPPSRGPLVSWYKTVPYVNWSEIVETVSCGWMYVTERGGGWTYTQRNNIMRTFALVKSQWRIEKYVDTACKSSLPQGRDAKLLESTALGLALQALMQRLPSASPQEFAQWLAAPDKSPFTVRKTMMQIQGIQKRRTQLSSAWLEIFPPRPARSVEPHTPPFFWDKPDEAPAVAAVETAHVAATEWKGLPVCGGQVTGRAIILKNAEASLTALDPSEFPILVFPRARPETVELFPHASGLLFAEGGALSHACTVAREQGIPTVTGIGQDFLRDIHLISEKQGKLWLSIDGAAGTVKVLPQKE